MFTFDYSAAKDYTQGPNALPNGDYAVNQHPSEKVIAVRGLATLAKTGSWDGYDAPATVKTGRFVYKDSQYPLNGNETTAMMYVHATESTDDSLIGDATKSHHYGYGTCENIRPCSLANEKVGSKCAAKQANNNYLYGYCYTSGSGSLECGRMLAIDSRFANSPKILDAAVTPSPRWNALETQVSRCPAGAPIDYTGKTTSKRLLIGGCMIPGDANFRPTAEVHVPEDCTAPADYKKGCIFPGADNYSPGSVQPGTCRYKNPGCTTAGSLNYNPDATENDGTCVANVPGCTVSSDPYAGPHVGAGTPMKYGLYVGKALPNVGRIVHSGYQAVTNYNEAATVNTGCIVAIEGCKDPTAVNYDPRANVQSSTWCIARKSGCMMPDPSSSVKRSTVTTRSHYKDGGSGSFDPTATVHSQTACSIGRLGCTDKDAVNYDAKATIDDGSCFVEQEGCLDRSALNFNCTRREAPFTKCTDKVPRATKHAEILCIYEIGSPPPPSPAVPAGIETQQVVAIVMVMSGTPDDYTEEVQDKMKDAFLAKLDGITKDDIIIIITAASVNVEFQIKVEDAAAATTLKSSVAEEFASADAAESFFKDVPGVKVLSTPVVEEKIVAAITPPGPPPASPTGAIVGGVVGGLGGLLSGLGAYYMVRKRKAAGTTYPA
jgi:hypothetical protein